MTRVLALIVPLLLLACDDQSASSSTEPKRQLSDGFVDSPTDADWEVISEMAAEYEASASPREVAATKVQAFLDAYHTAREAGRGDVFVTRVKRRATESAGHTMNGRRADARADALLSEAYDVWDRAHPSRIGQYSTDELLEILALATTYAREDGDNAAADVLEGSLIHVVSAISGDG